MTRGPRTQLLVRMAYEGSRFRGVPPQPNLPTVTDAVRARVEAAFGGRARSLIFAARTDAGVHAVENLATCWIREDLVRSRLRARLREGLRQLAEPREDGLLACVAAAVPTSVFARTVGQAKHYRYRLEGKHDPAWIARLRALDLARRRDPSLPRLPAEQGRIWQVALTLDPKPMRRAAEHLVGTHDFRAFKVGPLGERSPIRTVTGIEIHSLLRDGREHLVIDITGTGFLRKMVRIIVGTLAEVGAGLRDPNDIARILATRDRQQSGQAALARGLVLRRIETSSAWFDSPTGAAPWREPPELPEPT